MDNHTQRIVNKAWSYAHVLRDAGLPFHSYTEQITLLLFLKMADERTKPPYNQPPMISSELDWQSLLARDGQELGSSPESSVISSKTATLLSSP